MLFAACLLLLCSQVTKKVTVLDPRLDVTIPVVNTTTVGTTAFTTTSYKSPSEALILAMEAGTLSLPDIRIKPLGLEVINSNQKLVIEGSLGNYATYINRTAFEWSVVDGVLNITDYPNSLGSNYTSLNLVIKANVLTPGQTYTLKLTATDTITQLSASDYVTFTLNAPPSSGQFLVTPTEGVAAETEFLFNAPGWEDDSGQPVQFEFRYYDPASGTLIPLISRIHGNKVSSVMPLATNATLGNKLNLTLYAVDGFEAKSMVNTTITVTTPDILGTPSTAFACDLTDSSASPLYGCPCACQFLGYMGYPSGLVPNTSDSTCNITGLYSSITTYVAPGTKTPAFKLPSFIPDPAVYQPNASFCWYNASSTPAFLKTLVDSQLAIAKATGNVGVLLTLSKIVADQSSLELLRLQNQTGYLLTDPTFNYTSANATARTTYEGQLVRKLLMTELLDRVLNAIYDAVTTTQIRLEELDQFGAVLKSVLQEPQLLPEASMTATANNALTQVVEMSVSTGISSDAAQSLVESTSSLDTAQSTNLNAATQSATQSVMAASRRALLAGMKGSRQQVAEIRRKTAEIQATRRRLLAAQTDANTQTLHGIVAASLNGAGPGEDPAQVTSPTYQVSGARTQELSGSFGLPAAPGKTADSAPSVGLANGLTQAIHGIMSSQLGIDTTSSVPSLDLGGVASQKNAYSDGVTNMQGQVLNFEIKTVNPASKLESSRRRRSLLQSPAGTSGSTIPVQLNDTQPAINITIPVSVTGSACRLTVGGCRYWNGTAWDTTVRLHFPWSIHEPDAGDSD